MDIKTKPIKDIILGVNNFKTNKKYVCFLPFIGEFGWYLLTHVPRFNGYNHNNKIACIKRGHECLFPTANHFFYDWEDIADNKKAGIIPNKNERLLKEKITKLMNTNDIHFVSPSDLDWDNKDNLYKHMFMPQPTQKQNIAVDVVVCPRLRQMDTLRNIPQNLWQDTINLLKAQNLTIGLCGTKETSHELTNIKHYAYDYIDVDSDVELMLSAKIVIAQESGLAYLSYLCERPTIILGLCFPTNNRNKNIYFENLKKIEPEEIVKLVTKFIDDSKKNP